MLDRFKLLRITSSGGSNDLLSTSPYIPFTCEPPLIDLKSNIYPGYYSGATRELVDLRRATALWCGKGEQNVTTREEKSAIFIGRH